MLSSMTDGWSVHSLVGYSLAKVLCEGTVVLPKIAYLLEQEPLVHDCTVFSLVYRNKNCLFQERVHSTGRTGA